MFSSSFITGVTIEISLREEDSPVVGAAIYLASF
jgi:hypothetical protein